MEGKINPTTASNSHFSTSEGGTWISATQRSLPRPLKMRGVSSSGTAFSAVELGVRRCSACSNCPPGIARDGASAARRRRTGCPRAFRRVAAAENCRVDLADTPETACAAPCRLARARPGAGARRTHRLCGDPLPLKAAEALAIFYDLADNYRAGQAQGLWVNVAAHCLYLLALLPAEQPRTLAFLHARPQAQAHLDQLTQFTTPEIARAAQATRAAYQRWRTAPRPEPPPLAYVQFYRQCLRNLDAGQELDLSSWLTGRDRIVQAMLAGDAREIVHWSNEGSPPRWARRCVSRRWYWRPPPIKTCSRACCSNMAWRRSAVSPCWISSCRLNQQANLPAGAPALNRLLAQVAMACDERSREVAQAAMQAAAWPLARAYNDLLAIIAHAPSRNVAEWAIEAPGSPNCRPIPRR